MCKEKGNDAGSTTVRILCIVHRAGRIWRKIAIFVNLQFNRVKISPARRDARAVEWGGLENRYMGNYIEGSNPSLSAKIFYQLSFFEIK
jgi:hypothetical protein